MYRKNPANIDEMWMINLNNVRNVCLRDSDLIIGYGYGDDIVFTYPDFIHADRVYKALREKWMGK